MAHAFIAFEHYSNAINIPEPTGPALPAKDVLTPSARTQHDSGYLGVIPRQRAGKHARPSRLLPLGNF